MQLFLFSPLSVSYTCVYISKRQMISCMKLCTFCFSSYHHWHLYVLLSMATPLRFLLGVWRDVVSSIDMDACMVLIVEGNSELVRSCGVSSVICSGHMFRGSQILLFFKDLSSLTQVQGVLSYHLIKEPSVHVKKIRITVVCLKIYTF